MEKIDKKQALALSVSVFAATLSAPALATEGPLPADTPPRRIAVAASTLHWPVKKSLQSYLGDDGVRPSPEIGHPKDNPNRKFVLTADASRSSVAADGTVTIAYAGTMHFYKYYNPALVLDIRLSDIKVVVTGAKGHIQADVVDSTKRTADDDILFTFSLPAPLEPARGTRFSTAPGGPTPTSGITAHPTISALHAGLIHTFPATAHPDHPGDLSTDLDLSFAGDDSTAGEGAAGETREPNASVAELKAEHARATRRVEALEATDPRRGALLARLAELGTALEEGVDKQQALRIRSELAAIAREADTARPAPQVGAGAIAGIALGIITALVALAGAIMHLVGLPWAP